MQADDLPPTLYHYTSLATLASILEHRAYWASDLAYMNDQREFLHATDIFVDQLRSPRFGSYTQANQREVLDRLPRFLATLTIPPIYVFSLSGNGNQLSQWRAYTPPGAGVSLGFDVARLVAVATTHGFRLVKCQYSLQAQKDALEPAFAALESLLASLAPQASPTIVDSKAAFKALLPLLYRIAPQIKHSSFIEEDEWRLVCDNAPDASDRVRTRVRGHTLIPYYDLPLVAGDGSLPLKTVYIGPTADTASVRRALEVTFRSTSPGATYHISPSGIPLR